MARRADPERIYTARREAHLSRLSARMTLERAEQLVAAWETEAARRGRLRHEETFWRDGGRWIDEHRARQPWPGRRDPPTPQ